MVQQAAATNQAAQNRGASSAADEGWEQATTQVEVFWDKETGICEGKLIGGKIVQSNMGPSTLYSIQLHKDCQCEKGKGKDKKKVMAKAGEVIGVWGSGGLKELDTLSGCLVKISPLPVQNLSGGRTFYPFDIKFKGARKALQMSGSTVDETAFPPEDDSNIPIS